jgi:steroid delta-isomerase-like uncharacterized protein
MPTPHTVMIARLLEEMWNKRNLAVIDDMFLADATVVDPTVPAVTTVESFKQFVASFLTAFPELHLTLDDGFAADDKVAARWTVRGTHKGAFFGVAPTEQVVIVTGITLFRLVGDQIAECWTQWDSSGLMQQLGSVTSTPPNAGA